MADVRQARLPDLPRALHVDDEHHVVPALEAARRIARVRAIEVAEHVGVLEELAVGQHRLEAFAAHKIIVHAVGLVLPRRA